MRAEDERSGTSWAGIPSLETFFSHYSGARGPVADIFGSVRRGRLPVHKHFALIYVLLKYFLQDENAVRVEV